MNERRSLFQRWPADRFYWAVLEAPGMLRPAPLPEALYPELADEIPVPVDEVFAVAAPVLPDGSGSTVGRVVVCAMRRADLEEVAHLAHRFVPDSIPPGLGVEASAWGLNFMVGDYEPREARVARFRVHALRGLAVLVIAGLLCAGWARRAAHFATVESSAREEIAGLARAAALGHDAAAFELAVDAELARVRRAAEASGAAAPPPDAALALAGLLSAWPAQVPSRPQSISVGPATILASVALDGDAGVAFLGALRPPVGWTLDEPRMNSAGGLTRLSLCFTPSGPAERRAETPRTP